MACGSASGPAGEIASLRDQMCACKDAACAQRIDQQARAIAPSPMPPDIAQPMLELEACRDKLGHVAASDAGVVASLDAAAGAPVALPAACDDYKRAHERVASCKKLGVVKDQLERAYTAITGASALTGEALGEACKTNTRTMSDALDAAGCK